MSKRADTDELAYKRYPINVKTNGCYLEDINLDCRYAWKRGYEDAIRKYALKYSDIMKIVEIHESMVFEHAMNCKTDENGVVPPFDVNKHYKSVLKKFNDWKNGKK